MQNVQAVTYRHARLVIRDNEKINRMYWSNTPSAGGRGISDDNESGIPEWLLVIRLE